jgi:hypothetical protein
MPNTPYTEPVGGFWPLGKIIVTTAGVPVPLTQNVGSQKQGGSYSLKKASRVRQYIFTLDSASGGNIYITKSPHSYTDTNCVVLVCWNKGVEYSLPHGCLLDGALVTPDDLYVDADADGCAVWVTAIYG